MDSRHLHEDLSRHSADEKSSERGLGITFAVVFLLVGLGGLYSGHDWWIACLSIAAVFILLAYLWVAPLRPLNIIWHRFGLLLFHIVNPIVMGAVFFSTIFPIGVLMRFFGKDPLKLKLDHEASTYWQERAHSEATPQSMKNQF
jgi:hypothetical protein